ncbi:immunoglobulin domain-containing protein [Haloferula sp. A504]|uniref:immunoglobulin domain-containing protein n=1 Tax=Haloferula sp. A504 TaxID=3373601 RepID=UPI0031BCED1C|nr:immunoglobulin domain-containing protein [Verrucomicrobiaceae bacterium E54]
MLPRTLVLAATATFLNHSLHAAPDTVDSTFASALYRNTENDFGSVASLLVLPDGSILVGSNEMATTLEAPDNLQAPLLRLNPDGSVADDYFADDDPDGEGEGIVFVGSGWPEVMALGRQSDGKIIAGGVMTGMNDGTTNVVSRSIVRIHADGTADGSFQSAGTIGSFNGLNYINHLIIDPDDKIVVGGGFRGIQNQGEGFFTQRQGIARLNADGSLDTGFVLDPVDFGISPGFSSSVSIVIYQVGRDAAGNYYVVGEISGAGLPVQVFARLFPDGSRDFSFAPDLPEARWNSVDLDTQGRITVTGLVDFNPTVAYRVFADGSIDNSFNLAMGLGAFQAQPLEIDTAGRFIYRSGATLGRILADGSVDPSFTPTASWVNWTTSPSFNLATTAPDGSIYAGGFFDHVEGTPAVKLVRFDGDPVSDALRLENAAVSVVESAGTLYLGVTRVGPAAGGATVDLATIAGSALAGVDFTTTNGTLSWAAGETGTRYLAIPLIDNGSTDGDKSFSVSLSNASGAPVSGANPAVITLVDDEAGPTITAQPLALEVREGSSATFTVGVSSASPVTFQWLKNGDIIPGATGISYTIVAASAADAANYGVEVTASGVSVTSSAAALTVIPPKALPDPAFSAPSLNFSTSTVFSADGSFLTITGNFATGYTVTPHASDGTPGTAWPLITTNANSGGLGLLPLPDGKFIALGDFTVINGESRRRIARFNSDGTLDTGFVPFFNDGTFPVGEFTANFSFFSGVKVGENGGLYALIRSSNQGTRFFRFNEDGSADTSFNLDYSFGTSGYLYAVHELPDGSVLIGYTAGGFGSLDRGIRRLLPDGSFDPNFPLYPTSSNVAGLLTIDDDRFLAIHGNLLTVHDISDGSLLASHSFTGTLTNIEPFRSRFLVTGPTAFGATPLPGLGLFSLDGSVDDNFPGGSGPDEDVTQAKVLDDGSILARGNFTTWNGAAAPGMVRLLVEGAEVGFATLSAIVLENAGPLTVELVRYGDAGNAASVRVTSSPDSATSPADFATVDQIIPWAAGDSSPKSLSISLVDDADIEGDETFTLNLSEASGAEAIPGALSVTLRDDDSLPQITSQPAAVQAVLGLSASFTVAATSPTALTYQWFKDGSEIPGATSATYDIASVVEASEGTYSVRLTNDYGFVNSTAASLTIIPDPAALAPGYVGPGLNSSVVALDSTPDGGAVIVGNFTDVGGNTAIDLVARVNADGTLDSSFVPPVIGSGSVLDVAVQPDGKVVIVGSFSTVGGISLRGMARLNADGSLDTAFAANVTNGTNGNAFAVDILADGRIAFGGRFTAWNGQTGTGYDVFVANADGTYAGRLAQGAFRDVKAVKALPDGGVLFSVDTTSSSTVKVFKFGADLLGRPFSYSTGRTRVDAIDIAADGDYLFAGNGQVLKINPDGTTDSNASLFSASEVAGQINGKFVVAGGTPTGRPVRYLPNATLDPSFLPGTGFNSSVQDLAVRLDGKIWAGGNFTSYNGTPVSYLALLNGDPVNLAITSQPAALTVVDPGEEVTLSVAAFGTSTISYQWFRNGIEMVDGPGVSGSQTASLTLSSVDDADSGSYTVVLTNTSGTETSDAAQVTVLGAPEILSLSGDVSQLEGNPLTLEVTASGASTLTYQWFLDSVILPGQTSATLTISPAGLDDSGSYTVRVSNSLGFVDSDPITVTISPNEAAIAPDWTGPTANGTVFAILPLTSGSALVGGNFSSISDGTNSSGAGLAVVNEDGSVVPVPGLSATGGTVRVISQQSDGKFLLGGSFTAINGTSRGQVARLNADFSLDTGFTPDGVNAFGQVRDIREEASGSIMVAGEFGSYNNLPDTAYAVRLTSSGAHDPSFTSSANSWVTMVRPQSDGTLVLGGWTFDWAGNTAADHLFRVSNSGTAVENTIVSGFFYVRAGTQLPNGDLLVSQDFGSAVRRYSLGGTLLQSFSAGGNVNAFAEDGNGSLLFGGTFTTFGGASNLRIARVLADGSADPIFDPGSGFDGDVEALAIAPSGGIWVGGGFSTYNGIPATNLILLKGDGSAPTDPFTDFVAGLPGGQQGEDDDPDGDGWANLVEFLFGTDPGNAATAPAPLSTGSTSTGASLNSTYGLALDPAKNYRLVEVEIPTDLQGLSVALEASTDLSFSGDATATEVGTPTDNGTTETRRYVITPATEDTATLFWRLAVTR